jgi:uncharacterized protein
MINAQKIIAQYGLEPLPQEGGYYKEVYRSVETIPGDFLPKRYRDERSYFTTIYYLLTSETISLIHRIKSDEVFHYYSGDPVEILQLYPNGKGKVYTIGNRLSDGDNFQLLVPHGVWQGMQLNKGGEFAFMGTTVVPGFELEDFELGIRDSLIMEYPDFKEKIMELTK